MINKFDTYSQIMPDYCMDCPAKYSKCQQFQDYGEGFWFKSLKIAWKSTLIFIYVVGRHHTIILMKFEKNLITVFMSFNKIFVLRNFKFCWVSNKNASF